MNDEDERHVTRVQRASRSRLAVPGRISPKEAALVDFYRYLGRVLGAGAATARCHRTTIPNPPEEGP